MDVNLAHGASTNSVSLPFNEVLPALSNKTLFWRPKFLANDQGVAHIPFLFWIVESIRPDITVQLGFGNGSSYYAVCQAIDKLDISGSCYAIEPNLDVKQQYNEAQYHEFSRLQDLPYDRAAEQFKSQSIDLLHINLSADHVTLTQLLAVWLPYLSEKAVILVQNSQTSEQPNFVSLCQQLKKQYSTFELVQENGLLAIAVAQIPSESFARLLTFQLHSKAYDLVQNVFARLGKACSEVVRTQNALEQVQQVQSQLHEREQELEISQQKIAELLKSLNDHKTWLSNRKNEVADLGDQLKSSVESAAQEHAQAEQRVRMLEQVRSELKQEIETLFSHVETLRNEQHTIKLEAEKWQKNAQALSEGKNELNQLLINVSVELESVKTSLEQQREENNSLQNKLTAQHNQHVEQLKQLNSDQEIVCQRLRDDALQELDEVKRQLGNQLAQANEERVL
ncbi:class I SAM-dependent methyltransferase, partial [Rheinheimera baltica]